jgi:hypothetical protein
MELEGVSPSPLETHFLIGAKLGFFAPIEIDRILEQTAEVGRMLTTLVQKLAQRHS